MSTAVLDAFRSRFPIFEKRVYANSCSQGALSLDVESALGSFTASWHEHGSPWEEWVGELERLRQVFARAVGADPDEVAIMPSASTAVTAIATALSFAGERRKVVIGEFEFPTMGHVWLAEEKRGAEIAWVRAQGETMPLDAYQAAIDERTLIVPATHVCYRNGFRTDVPGLVTLCRERGAYCLLDDYQRTGTGPIDVHALGVDFMVTGALKYLLGPSGVAFLYVRRALIERLEPLATGWFGRSNPFAFRVDNLDWSPTARRFEAGTPPIPNIYAATAGIELLNGIGLATVETRVADLVQQFADGARGQGWELITPADPARRGPLVVLRAANASEIVQRLQDRGVVASARGTGLRVSFHAYNNGRDVDRVLEALATERRGGSHG